MKYYSQELIGRRRICKVSVEVFDDAAPWVFIHRRDEYGNRWNHFYTGWRTIERGYKLQQLIIEKEKVTE
jgi:hypothetical protein